MKYLLAGLIAVVLCGIILIIYYRIKSSSQPHKDSSLTRQSGLASPTESMPDAAKQKKGAQMDGLLSSQPEMTSPDTQEHPSMNDRPSEEEKILYSKTISSFIPEVKPAKIYGFKEPAYRRNPTANLQETVRLFEEIIKKYPDSPYYQHYQETNSLVKQMIQEDKTRKYFRRSGGMYVPRVVDNTNPDRKVSLEEETEYYIYDLRNTYFYKQRRYNLIFELSDGGILTMPDTRPPFHAIWLVKAGESSVPKLLTLLADRRPMIIADDTKIPVVFYRYQDAAVEILQRMFPKTQRPFPVELPVGEYFSEYLEKQSPEDKQKIINDIKAWVEEALNNPVESPDKK